MTTGSRLRLRKRELFRTIGYEPHMKDAALWPEKGPALRELELDSHWVDIDPRLARRDDEQLDVDTNRAARDPQRSSHAGGAADVFDDELLTKRLRHADCKDARRRIGRAARCNPRVARSPDDHRIGPGRRTGSAGSDPGAGGGG